MPAITISDLANAKLDVDHIAEVATSTAPTATDRLGHTKSTMQGAVDSLKAFNNRGAWVADTDYAVKELVTSGGTWYACVVPHTSSAAFSADEASKWRVYQGITSVDLGASDGADRVGFSHANTYAEGTLGAKAKRLVCITDAPYSAVADGESDCYPAWAAAKAAVGTGVIRFPGNPGDVYLFATYPNAAEVLDGPLLDVDPGVIIRIPQALGLDATYGNSSIRVVRETQFHQSITGVTFFASPQTSGHIQERHIWPSASDADKSSVSALDCTTAITPLKILLGSGDTFEAASFGATTASTFSFSAPHDGYVYLGMAAIGQGEALSCSFSGFHNTSTALFAVVRCDGGYYGAYGGNANGYLTQFSKLTGAAFSSAVVTPETYQHDSYRPLSSVMSVKVRGARKFSICLNGVSAIDVDTASDIVDVGFGVYDLGPTGCQLTVQDVCVIKNAPIVHGVRGLNIAVFGDSLTAGSGTQHVYGSWPEQLKKNYDGAAGIRIKTVTNFAVPGATSGTQSLLCTAGSIANVDYVWTLLGTNDIQGGVSVASYLSTMGSMIDTCLSAGKRVIVGVPPMFYSQAMASGLGGNTTNFQAGAAYRSGLIRLCAVKGVKCVDTLGGMGNIIAPYLDTSFSQDPMVYDNAHPSFFGRVVLAQLFGNALLGDLA